VNSPDATTLREEYVRDLIERWNDALARRASLEELHGYFANGLLIELPDRALRGRAEFDAWYGKQPATAVARYAATGGITVRILSPKHAQAEVDGRNGRPRQSIGVVLQDGIVRIRTVVLRTNDRVAA
jgi:hypothetical protein